VRFSPTRFREDPIFLPRLAQQAAVASGDARRSDYFAQNGAVPAALAGAALLAFFAEAVLRLLLGASFAAGTGALQILLLAAVVSFASVHGRNVLLARGQQRLDLLFVGIASRRARDLQARLDPGFRASTARRWERVWENSSSCCSGCGPPCAVCRTNLSRRTKHRRVKCHI